MKRVSHTFVICAYKESPYLEECILSLKKQRVTSKIIMVTSTPNQFLKDMADKYEIPFFVNPGEGGITQDWNFGLSKVETKLATIAHQDDIYEPEYLEEFLSALSKSAKPIIAFSDYGEIRNGVKTTDVQMLKIKKLMLLPLRFKPFYKSIFIRRRVLSMGDPICCPSVMFVMKRMPEYVFKNHFICCEDWEAWERLSRKKGSFVYIPKPLMYHRIHDASTTTKTLEAGGRIKENYEMFRKFWPSPVAKLINKLYTKSEDSNKI